jgi:hypothetical protein
MNEFTKEELQSILWTFKYVTDDPGWRSTIGWDDKLQTKIQSMIDSYCEHVWNHKHESGFVVCDKCEKVYAE